MTGTRGPLHHPMSGRSQRRFGGGIRSANAPDRVRPAMPEVDFPPHAQEFWRAVEPFCSEHGLLEGSCIYAFIQLCRLYAELKGLDERITAEGSTVTTPRGYVKEHPLLGYRLKLRRSYIELSQQFGLTPIARARLGINIVSEIDRGDPFEPPPL